MSYPVTDSLKRIPHGGGCCGLNHIFNLSNDPKSPNKVGYNSGSSIVQDKQTKLERLKSMVEEFDKELSGKGGMRCLEINITDSQDVFWAKPLLDLGFKMLMRFKNQNSSNYVNHYIRYSGNEVFYLPSPSEFSFWPLIEGGQYEFEDGSPFIVDNDVDRRNDGLIRGRALANHRIGEVRISNDYFYNLSDGWYNGRSNDTRYPRIRNVRPVIETAPTETSVILEEFFGVRRDGRWVGPFASVARVTDEWPNITNFMRRCVMSDGTTTSNSV
jgi:hypothetical protein